MKILCFLNSPEREELPKIWFDFQNSRSFLYKNYQIRPLHPQNQARTLGPKKVSIWFFRFSRVWVVKFHIAKSVRGPRGLTWIKMLCQLYIRVQIHDLFKTVQNGPKWSKIKDIWIYFWKSDYKISSILKIQLGDNIRLILPKTACPAKNRVWIYVPRCPHPGR